MPGSLGYYKLLYNLDVQLLLQLQENKLRNFSDAVLLLSNVILAEGI